MLDYGAHWPVCFQGMKNTGQRQRSSKTTFPYQAQGALLHRVHHTSAGGSVSERNIHNVKEPHGFLAAASHGGSSQALGAHSSI